MLASPRLLLLAANGHKVAATHVPPRATETILSVAARCILSGSDGVTAREVADALTKMTCERARKSPSSRRGG